MYIRYSFQCQISTHMYLNIFFCIHGIGVLYRRPFGEFAFIVCSNICYYWKFIYLNLLFCKICTFNISSLCCRKLVFFIARILTTHLNMDSEQIFFRSEATCVGVFLHPYVRPIWQPGFRIRSDIDRIRIRIQANGSRALYIEKFWSVLWLF